jgi:hypothetical protein
MKTEDAKHLTRSELEAGLDEVRRAPATLGVLEMIVRRPRVEARELLDAGMLDPTTGLAGDNWAEREHSRTPDGSLDLEVQLTVMNARAARLVAGDRSRWALAGDQLYVDFDLGAGNLPPGARLAIGAAVIEVSAEPHTGCGKFVKRFGVDAMKFVNSPVGRELRLRGINAKVVTPGEIRVGDAVKKLEA